MQKIMRFRFIQNSLLVVSSLLLTIGSIDFVALFIWDIKPPGYKRDRFFEFSPLLGWTHRPNSDGYWYRYIDGAKHYVSINSHGFADSERDITKRRPRIALIGDSTTEFWETDTKDRGQYVIEELLNRKFEVLNFGVRGYGTDQTYLLFRNKGVHFSPNIVVYTFCINDIWDNANPSSKPYFDLDPNQVGGIVLKGYPISNKKTWHMVVGGALRDYSFAYRKLQELKPLLEHKIKRLLKKTDPTSTTATPLEYHFELRPYQKVYQSEDHRRMEITTRILSLLKDFIESRGMKLLVVEGLYKPVLDENRRKRLIETYGDKFDFDQVSRILAEHTKKKQIAFLSLPQQLKEHKIDVSGLMHPEDSLHLNREGIQFYSQAVVAKLRSLHWVTESAKVNLPYARFDASLKK